ncbi:protein of unknown function [Pararobbsia alpina]
MERDVLFHFPSRHRIDYQSHQVWCFDIYSLSPIEWREAGLAEQASPDLDYFEYQPRLG